MRIWKKLNHVNCRYGADAPKIILGGDFIFDQNLLPQLARQKYDAEQIFDDKIRSVFKPDDIFCFNFEGVLSEKGARRPKVLPPAFSFRSPPEAVRLTQNLARPVFSLANNHVMDFGREALEDMLRHLESKKIPRIGAGKNAVEASRPLVLPLGTCQIGLVAYTNLLPDDCYAGQGVSGAARLTAENLEKGIRQARAEGANFVIVSLHVIRELNSPFSIFPDSYQIRVSREAVEAGADVVFGHQPHGLQLWERFKGKLIFYSLGALIYNPLLGEYFPKEHTFYESTQANGGGIVTLNFCKHALPVFNVVPTRAAKTPSGEIKIIRDSRLRNVRRALFNGYLSKELWMFFREN